MEVLLICGGVLAPNGIYFVNYDITQILELKKRKSKFNRNGCKYPQIYQL
jgi:hypothetical protein